MVHRLRPECGWFLRPKTREFLTRRSEVRHGLQIAKFAGLTRQQFDRLPSAEREDWAAEWLIEQATHDCGLPIDVCSDPEAVIYTYRRICYATMERAAAEAAYEALHEKAPYHDGTHTRWSEKRSRAFPYKANEGVTIGVDTVDRAPWDLFTTEADASPLRPSSDGQEE